MPVRPKCTEAAASGKWRIGQTGKPMFDNEEDCVKAWNAMNGGAKNQVQKFPTRSQRTRPSGRRSTLRRRY